MDSAIEVPAVVRNTAIAAGAAFWLDGLPDLVAGLEHDWSIAVGRAYSDATEAFVAEATLADGTPVVLKVLVPGDFDGAVREITVLRLAGGSGCARLLRADETEGAMLLERLGRPLSQMGLPIEQRHEILCATAERLWRPAPRIGLPSGAEKGRRLIDGITELWEQLDRPCSAAAIDHARGCGERRIAAHDDERSVLVHGDVHQWNTLEAGDGFKFVDPDGLLAEPEYDLGILMREDAAELLVGDPHERARWLATRTGFDEAAIWEWGVVERVSDGLLCIRDGLERFGRESLAVADRLAR